MVDQNMVEELISLSIAFGQSGESAEKARYNPKTYTLVIFHLLKLFICGASHRVAVSKFFSLHNDLATCRL